MAPLALTLLPFVVWWSIGLALLAALRVDLLELRNVLSAPVLGSAVTLVPLFLLSHAGVSMSDAARPVTIVLVGSSVILLALRRPSLSRAVAPVVLAALANLLLVGTPLLDFGFHWVANANDDMANYVLSATQLLHHGLLTPLDVTGLSTDRDFPAALQPLHDLGARPGTDILLAAFAGATGRTPYELFMPLILALNMCAVCGAAALTMQASRKWWVATVAAVLLAISPLASYGVLQQLVAQVWGLGLAAVLVALLMRPELHGEPGPRIADIVLVGIVATALVAAYIELASTIAIAYVIYLAALALTRQIVVRSVARLLLPAAAILAVTLNSYLLKELDFVRHQASGGLAISGHPPTFGFALIPSALPSIVGLQDFQARPGASYVGLSIVVAGLLLTAVVIASLAMARRGIAAATVLVAYLGLGALLWVKSADFGLFKLDMYVQPFLAASVAVWIGHLERRLLLVLVTSLLVVVAAAELHTQHVYVERSRNPIDLRHASYDDLLPAFRRTFASARVPVVSATDNPTLAKLQAAGVGSRPLYLISRDIVGGLVRANSFPRGQHGWNDRSFKLFASPTRVDRFSENTHASELLHSDRCLLVEQTGTQLALNRLSLPEGSPDLSTQRCSALNNRLIFTVSQLGQSFYLPKDRKAVSFYQLEPDFFFQGRTLMGFGRYALFRVAGASVAVRLALSLTTTLRHDESNTLPPASVVGDSRVRLPLVGRGSARVYSKPLRPQIIGGQPYLLLDMGREPKALPVVRSGIQGLFNSSVTLDPRLLTSYVRDISLVNASRPGRIQAPSALQHFPADLGNPGLEYSGIYEDGWIAEDSYAVFAGGPARPLVVRAQVLPRPHQHLTVLVDGKPVRSSNVSPGELSLTIPVQASNGKRRVELRWAGSVHLRKPDGRPVSALLRSLGFPAPPASLSLVPRDLENPALAYSGIYKDGWLQKDARLLLAGGPASRLTLSVQITAATHHQHLDLLVNGEIVASQPAKPGLLNLDVPIGPSNHPRHIQLRWSTTAPISDNDQRRAAALLTSIAVSQ